MAPEQDDLFGAMPAICTEEKDPMQSGLEAMADKSIVRYCERHYMLIEEIRKIGLPQPGQQFRLVTRRTFNAIQFLEYICERETVVDLRMAIYSINFAAAKILVDLVLNGYVQRATILMSNLRNKAHREKEEITKKLFMQTPGIDLFFCSSHAKTMAMRTKQGNFYSIEGSGNLAYNARVEQYVIDNDAGMFHFSAAWMDEIRAFLKSHGKPEFEDCATDTGATQ